VGENEVQELMKKHRPWFIFDSCPVGFAKKLLNEKNKIEKEMRQNLDSEEQEE